MTNAEKFKEVFGYKADKNLCILPTKVCEHEASKEGTQLCDGCVFAGWWDKEYKPCFVLASEYEDDQEDKDNDIAFSKRFNGRSVQCTR